MNPAYGAVSSRSSLSNTASASTQPERPPEAATTLAADLRSVYPSTRQHLSQNSDRQLPNAEAPAVRLAKPKEAVTQAVLHQKKDISGDKEVEVDISLFLDEDQDFPESDDDTESEIESFRESWNQIQDEIRVQNESHRPFIIKPSGASTWVSLLLLTGAVANTIQNIRSTPRQLTTSTSPEFGRHARESAPSATDLYAAHSTPAQDNIRLNPTSQQPSHAETATTRLSVRPKKGIRSAKEWFSPPITTPDRHAIDAVAEQHAAVLPQGNHSLASILKNMLRLTKEERAHIDTEGADDGFLVEAITKRKNEHTERIQILTRAFNDILHKKNEQREKERIGGILLRIEQERKLVSLLEKSRENILAAPSATEVASYFNTIFSTEISEHEVLKGRMSTHRHTPQEIDRFFRRCYPTTPNIIKQIDEELTEIFRSGGENTRRPDSTVTVRVQGPEKIGQIRGGAPKIFPRFNYTMRELALKGPPQVYEGRKFLIIDNLPAPIRDLYSPSTEKPSGPLRITTMLQSRVRSNLSKLDTVASQDCRVELWDGYFRRSLDKHIVPLIHNGQLEKSVLEDPKYYSIKFDYAGKVLMVPNLYAIQIRAEEYAVIDLHRGKIFIIRSSDDDGAATDRIMGDLISRNSDLSSLESFHRGKPNFAFPNQKSFLEIKPGEFQPIDVAGNSGQLIFEKKDSTRKLAADLVEAERRKLDSNQDYIFTTNLDSPMHVYLEGAKKVFNAMQWALMFFPLDAALASEINLLLNMLGASLEVAEVAEDPDPQKTQQAMTELMEYVGFIMIDVKSLPRLQGRGSQRLIKDISTRGDEPPGFGRRDPPATGIEPPLPAEDAPGPEIYTGDESPEEVPTLRGASRSKPETRPSETQPNEPGPPSFEIKENGDFEPLIRDQETKTLYVKEVRNEPFFGHEGKFHVVQQFTLEGVTYQTGYFKMDGIKIHLISRKGNLVEKNGAATLVITAHGLHKFDEMGERAIAALPPGVDLSFQAPFGYFVKDPGLLGVALSHQTMKPAILLSEKLPEATKSAAPRAASPDKWDATGIISDNVDPSGPTNFHDQTLLPYERDTEHRIHESLRANVASNKDNLIDVISIETQTLLGNILRRPFIRKYAEVKSIACRILLGHENQASRLPAGIKERFSSRLGIPSKEFDKIAKEYDKLIAKKDSNTLDSDYVRLTTYPAHKMPKKRSKEASEDDSYYYFDHFLPVVERTFCPSTNVSSEIVLGYIVGDEKNNSLYLPIEAKVELVRDGAFFLARAATATN